ncbi:glycosyltransferase [Photobacterium minamisatsumaniensis]|uniref:glycosyltransferase n=1 Tax=Photobacterium minamisatsumaniensis TaxID=2910233 RepID=UPI003D0DF564
MKKLSYISNQVIPSKSAESIFVAKSCDELASRFDIQVLCPYRKDFYIESDVKQHYSLKNNLNIKKLPFFSTLKGKYAIFHLMAMLHIIKHKTDLVYSRTVIGAYLSTLIGKDSILELHSLPHEKSVDGKLLRLIANHRRLVKFVAISDALKQDLSDIFGIAKDKIQVEHDATDVNPLVNCVKEESSNTTILGYVGSLYPGKGMEVISAMSKLGDFENVEYHIYGGSEDEIKHWQGKCSKNVIFRGYIPYRNIFDAINTFDICLLPNQPSVLCAGYNNNKSNKTDIGKYTSPMKMFDYMTSMKPIISSDLPILREVLNEEICYFAPHDNYDAWVNQVKYINLEQLEAQEKARKAQKICIEYYNWASRMNRVLGHNG